MGYIVSMFNINTKCILKNPQFYLCIIDDNACRSFLSFWWKWSPSLRIQTNTTQRLDRDAFLAPNRRQAIIWIYDDLVYRRKQASPGVN